MSSTLKLWPTDKGLRIGFLNINNARNKKDAISRILNNSGNNFHIFGFAETRLSDEISKEEFPLSGYSLLSLEPSRPLTTGIVVYCSNHIQYKRLHHFEQFNIESLWLEISLKHSKPFLVCFLYRNPAEKSDWFDRFNLLMDAVLLENKEIILLGDFNIDLSSSRKQSSWQYPSYGLSQLIDIPTRITSHSATTIDHIYTTHPENISNIFAPDPFCSDHSSVCLSWSKKGVKIPKPGPKIIYYRSFTKFNENAFFSDLLNSNLSYIYQLRDPDEALDFFISTFLAIYDKHAPLQRKKVKHQKKPPWLTPEIEKEIYYRDLLLKANKREEFKRQRNKVTSLLRKSQHKHIQNLVQSKDSKPIWKAINQLTGKSKCKPQPSVSLSAHHFNTHFTNVHENLITEDKSKSNDLSFLRQFCASKPIHSEFLLPPITVTEVLQYLLTLKP